MHDWLWPQKLFLILPLLSSSTRITDPKVHSPPLVYSQSLPLFFSPAAPFIFSGRNDFFKLCHVISFLSVFSGFPQNTNLQFLPWLKRPPLHWHVPLFLLLLPTPPSTITVPIQIPRSCCCFWLGYLSPKYPHILPSLHSPLCSSLTSSERGSLTTQSKKQLSALSMHADYFPYTISSTLQYIMCINLLVISSTRM